MRLKIIRTDRLPDCSASDVAAYYPNKKTIYIRKNAGFLTLLHELGHYFIDIIFPNIFKHRVQLFYDKLTRIIFGINHCQPKEK